MKHPDEASEPVARPTNALPLSASAVATGGVGLALTAVVFACYHRSRPELTWLALMWVSLAGVSGIMAALREPFSRNNVLCFVLSLALLSIDFALAMFKSDFSLLRLQFSPFVLFALVAPFAAIRARNSAVAPRYLLGVWLCPFALLLPAVGIAAVAGALKPQNALGFVLAAPFGPWATQAARAVDFPNAGEFFHLPLSIVLTATVAGLTYYAVTHPRRTAYAILPFAWVMVGWWGIALGQLLSAIE